MPDGNADCDQPMHEASAWMIAGFFLTREKVWVWRVIEGKEVASDKGVVAAWPDAAARPYPASSA